jgi:hypothetical protein
MPSEVLVRLRNPRRSPLRVVLEPWGDEALLGPDEELEVHAIGPLGDTLEFEFGADEIVVYGWLGSRVWLRREGGVLKAVDRPPVPLIPPSIGVVRFMRLVGLRRNDE